MGEEKAMDPKGRIGAVPMLRWSREARPAASADRMLGSKRSHLPVWREGVALRFPASMSKPPAPPLPDLRSRLHSEDAPLDMARIWRLWLPLAASWVCMGLELPLFTAFVARMANEEINLAAYGAVVFPISLVIEAPIIMLLAASTALAKDRRSYAKLRRFMHTAGFLLTLLHIAVAFTPLFDGVVDRIFDVQVEVKEAARVGLRIMTPWTWAIAYRRFQQGVLIRFDHSRAVALGTLVRLGTLSVVLAGGYALGRSSGIVVGTSAIALAVSAEALFARLCVRPILRERVPERAEGPGLTWAAFSAFYVPLALTPFLTLLVPPIGSAAMGRMPQELASLAAWPAVHGLVFLTRSPGFALNEVVVALIALPGAVSVLWRFTWRLAALSMGVLLLLGLTPLSDLWFRRLSDLSPAVLALATGAATLAAVMPINQSLQSFFQGALVAEKTTRPITEAVALYLVVAAALLALGVAWAPVAGILWTIPALSVAGLCQTGWLALRSRGVLAKLRRTDTSTATLATLPT